MAPANGFVPNGFFPLEVLSLKVFPEGFLPRDIFY
jgi:hypothetical protein